MFGFDARAEPTFPLETLSRITLKNKKPTHMESPIQQLIEEIRAKKVFWRNKKQVELKVLSALLYFHGLSTRKASKIISLFQQISHESVRIYYHIIKRVLNPPEKKKRRLIAIDETKLKL